MVILSSSHDGGRCYVMTANLDGETSLKTMQAASLTKDVGADSETLTSFVGYVECENPNPKLDNFLGRLTSLDPSPVGGDTCSLTQDNLLLCGTKLRNTREVYGACVYGGQQTKMMLNSKLTRIKFSTVEKSLNSFLLLFVAILLTEMTTSTILSLTLGKEYFDAEDTQPNSQASNKLEVDEDDVKDVSWYIGADNVYERNFKEGFQNWVTWLVLYSYIIPISMYVSMEIQKFVSAMFFGWDLAMYDEERDIPAKSNTSDINEELGLVTHLFTDKTGTLTRNVMVFRRYCTAEGGVRERDQLGQEPWGPTTMIMTLCHSVQVTEGIFTASSPDEKALLDVCKWAGFVYRGESAAGIVEVIAPGFVTPLRYKKELELEFDSYRKCMTVIVREDWPEGRILALTKVRLFPPNEVN